MPSTEIIFMPAFSIVIICKNEADIIGRSLDGLLGITDDIIVYDNGSTDGTPDIVKNYPVRLYNGKWEGFGNTKNAANQLAKYDWILSLDADETLDDELKRNLKQLPLNQDIEVFRFSFLNFLGDRPLRYGDWGNDKHIRLFNRKKVSWDREAVHEKLLLPEQAVIKNVEGKILHCTWRNKADYKNKMERYAELGAKKYLKQGKHGGRLRQIFSPSIAFIKSYLLKLGFLDGKAGFTCAGMMAYYTKRKYELFRKLKMEQEARK